MHLVVKYHSPRLFLSVDMQALFRVLFEAFPEGLSVEVQPMSSDEQIAASREILEFKLDMRDVTDIFQVYESHDATNFRRRSDLEQRVYDTGRPQVR